MRVVESLERAWKAIDSLGKSTLNDHAFAENMSRQPLTQEALIAYLDVIQCVRSTSKGIDGKEWVLPKLTRLMTIMKGTSPLVSIYLSLTICCRNFDVLLFV
jgi:hypothetical protein